MRLLIGLLSMMFLLGCESPVSCPADQELLDLFRANRLQFEELLQNPHRADLTATLKVERVLDRSYAGHRNLRFQVWHKDLPGPGGYGKGLAWRDDTPHNLVDSIDANSDPHSPEQKEIFQSLGDGWFIYFSANN